MADAVPRPAGPVIDPGAGAGRALRRSWPVLAAVFMDTVLLMGLVPLLPSLESDSGLSSTAIGFLLGAYSLSGLLLCLPLGLASDRWRPRPIFMAGVVGTLLSALVPALVPTPFGIGTGRLVQGLASAAVWTSGMVLVSEQLGPARRSLAIASIFSAASLGELVGPVASGFLSEQFGPAVFFRVAAGGLVLLVGMVYTVGRRRLGRQAGEAREHQMAAPGGARRVGLIPVAARAYVLFVIFTMLLLFVPFKLDRDLGFGPREIGLAFAAWNLIMIAAQMGAGRWAETGKGRRPLGVGMLVLLGALLVLSVAGGAAPVLGSLYLAAVGIGLASTVATAQLSERWEHMRPAGTGLGTAFGVTNTIWSLGFLSGNVVGGRLLDALPMPVLFAGMAALLIPFLVGMLWKRPARDPGPHPSTAAGSG